MGFFCVSYGGGESDSKKPSLSEWSILLKYLASFTENITDGMKKNITHPSENQNPFYM